MKRIERQSATALASARRCGRTASATTIPAPLRVSVGRWRGRHAPAVLLVVGFLLAGCGQSTSPPSAASGATSPPPSVSTPSNGSAAANSAASAEDPLPGHLVFSLQPSLSDTRGARIITVKADGTDLRELTPQGHLDNRPNLSPDGRTVLFQRAETASCDPVGSCDIWSVGIDGQSLTRLTECDPARTCLGNADPAWSPDGTVIALGRDQLDAGGTNHQGIFVMHPDGTSMSSVTNSGQDSLFGEPVFSPDGQRIAFYRETPDGGRLMIVNVDGTELREVLPNGILGAPDWSPDGVTIVFAGTGGNIEAIRPDGAGRHSLTHEPVGQQAISPSWSPDGSTIVYSETTPEGHCNLVTIDPAGQDKRLMRAVDGCARGTDWGNPVS